LYLRRYWQYEERLATLIQARATVLEEVNLEALREGLERLFPRTEGYDGQRQGALMALQRRFAVISGGPGTGKTSTVVKLLALLIEQADARKTARPTMVLLAPTGKAAARLTESIQRAKGKLNCDESVKRDIEEEASTIHRRLGPVPSRVMRFRHDADNPLAADLVLVDEASMVDLALMVKLFEAVPPGARLILLGDRDQLASVDAGAVLGDICNAEDGRSFSRGFRQRLTEVDGAEDERWDEAPEEGGIWDCVAHLSKSYRYRASSGIGSLSRAINAGDVERVNEVLCSGEYDDVDLVPLGERGALGPALEAMVTRGYEAYLRARDEHDKFEALGRFRVLCAHRRGAYGVEDVNRQVEGTLVRAGLLPRGGVLYYAGRPVLVTSNDYDVRLFNGDIGLMLEDEGGFGDLKAVFVGTDGSLRRLSVSRLPPHETAFAMTVHKSQGSEFDEVAVLLPETVSPILSRELLYTAVTRAKSKVTIFGSMDAVERAVTRRVQRASGLRERLWPATIW